MIFPSPAGSYLKPAAAGVQALSMNSLRSAWTPVLAGLKRFHYAGQGKIRSLCPRVILSVGLVQNIGQVIWLLLPSQVLSIGTARSRPGKDNSRRKWFALRTIVTPILNENWPQR
jgi:hypothetical protein